MSIHSDVQSAIENLKKHLKGSPERPAALFRLGTVLGLRGTEQRSLKDLDEGIKYYREALNLYPKGEVDARRQCLQNLACAFMTRYNLGNVPRDLDTCIDHFREATQLVHLPQESPDNFSLFTGHGIALRKRHELTSRLTDINEAVKLHTDALALLASDHGSRHWALFCLAEALAARGLRHKMRADINLAINHHKDAFTLWPSGDKNRYSPLYNVAYALLTCFCMSKDPTDLDESIQNYEAALGCITAEHPAHPAVSQHRDLALQKRSALAQRRPNTSLSFSASIPSSQDVPDPTHHHQSSQRPSKTSVFEMARAVESKCTMPLIDFINLVCSSSPEADGFLKSLHWYKEKNGVQHEFLVVQATPVDGGDPMWIRLDRAAKQAYAKTFRFWFRSDSSSSRFPADDCALICTEQWDALGDIQCDESYRCRFQPPLRLHIFVRLLKILSEESPHYTLAKENCWFFCSAITGVLTREFPADGERGSLTHLGFGVEVRKRIHKRFKEEILMSPGN